MTHLAEDQPTGRYNAEDMQREALEHTQMDLHTMVKLALQKIEKGENTRLATRAKMVLRTMNKEGYSLLEDRETAREVKALMEAVKTPEVRVFQTLVEEGAKLRAKLQRVLTDESSSQRE